MPSCCLIRPAGTSPTSSTSPATSPCCRCRQNHPNSTRSKTSGNSCATTGSPIVSSGPTTTSLSTVATPGTNSSISLGPSCRSACATGPTGSDQRDLVLGAVDFLAQHLQAQPLFFCGDQLIACRSERGSGVVKLRRVARIKIRVGEGAGQHVYPCLQGRDSRRKHLERTVVIVAHTARGCRGARVDARRGTRLAADHRRRRSGCRWPLRQHIGVAAGILDPAPVAFACYDRCHHAVEEVAVVADQQHGARIVGQKLL